MRTLWVIPLALSLLMGCSGQPNVKTGKQVRAWDTDRGSEKPTVKEKKKGDDLVYRGKHLNTWIKYLKEQPQDIREDADARQQAAEAITHYGARAKEAVPYLGN